MTSGLYEIHRDLVRLENLMELKKKCKVLTLGKNIPRHQYMAMLTIQKVVWHKRTWGSWWAARPDVSSNVLLPPKFQQAPGLHEEEH